MGFPSGLKGTLGALKGNQGAATSPLLWAAGQAVALAACSMTWATVCGSAIMDRCPALTSVMWAPARLAMKVSSAGGITRSAVPITAHDGMVLQAGAPDGSVKALAGKGRWVAAMTAACCGLSPVAKQPEPRSA